MILIEKHIIKKSHKDWKSIDQMCFYSKNLYNFALYTIKNHYESTGKWLRYNDLDKLMQANENYSLLPNATSQQILMVLDQNIKSYFSLIKRWKRDKKSLSGCPQFPKYKHKEKGRNLLVFTKIHVRFKDGFLRLPKKMQMSPIRSKVNYQDIKQIRIVPTSDSYKIEIIYEKQIQERTGDKVASIDLGLNNLATVFIEDSKPLIVNGKPLKSINQYYNKKKAEIQSQLEKNHKKKWSNKLQSLTTKRNNKVDDYLHKASRYIVDCFRQKEVGTVIIGLNKEWKTDINIGKKNNQNFVQIPHSRFIDMIEYKAKLFGIKVTVREESYTSKCSSLDLETVCKHDTYLGKRIKRGMFRSSIGKLINADLNGALNILRKEKPDKGLEIIQTLRYRGQVVWPVKINLNEYILYFNKL